jgi:hypothetical protein
MNRIGGVIANMLASGITFLNHIGGVMANMLASGAVDHGFDPWLGQTKDLQNWNLLLLS